MQRRSSSPRLTPEQLNAIDLPIFGKTDKEVAETIGIGRNTISKWYKNAFFIAELKVRREELWKEAKLRLKSLVQEAVDVFPMACIAQMRKQRLHPQSISLKPWACMGK